ncbi:MFS transporter [Microbacterium sp. EYE_5]|uniref:MFS transporter n=1 Tax=unclassified Microbacterium TaxID=2609290 RepID=UPI00200463CD|nr:MULTISPECIES: MFS transporter [unclassified Microbacterium]MCK6080127.1 MFS transporter [Microbacterium sp. EYE_382]MCK6085398.1 MFS transporter [Microbacterium sp. EYE_384]MCK6122377.1 MFS transporter [Microbacterium sp. EYE_80]MCK6126161.1 MFS transporter [Microbacterium sp. EYE_79]MCK6141082.1 MFS transporter [Microbacterium sp. EYE_39]
MTALDTGTPTTTAAPPAEPRLLSQPPAVWAIAFAAMVAFMGIGLVGPILPTVAADLHATPVQTSLLFTSYLVVTASAMFFTSWLSTRIGTRAVMIIGLSVIALSAVGCALSPSVGPLIGFRAVWGLGNALFLSTALASIVSASGGRSAHAVILYEAALGIGLAVGPLVGGLLGQIGWFAPFWGTASLFAVGVAALLVLVRDPGRAAQRSALSAPFRAFSDRGLLAISVVAFLYNAGFFVTLSYTPYALELPAVGIGLVMMGFGIGLAIAGVVIAPRLTRRSSVVTVLLWFLIAFAATHVAAALSAGDRPALITCVVLLGVEIGAVNTILTEAAMEATTLPRAVASSAYSGFRFFGGAIGAPVGTALAVLGAGAPYAAAAVAAAIGAALLFAFRRLIGRAEHRVALDDRTVAEDVTLSEG